MKKLFLLLCCLTTLSQSAIKIRPAIFEDLPAILALDKKLSFEYFAPLVYKNYGHFLTLDHIAKGMEEELQTVDVIMFAKAIAQQEGNRLHVAIYELGNKELIGWVHSVKTGTVLEVGLSMVYPEWQDTQVEEYLVKAAIQEFPDVTTCFATPLQCNKQACQLYEKLGFVNKGPNAPGTLCIHGFGQDKWTYRYELELE